MRQKIVRASVQEGQPARLKIKLTNSEGDAVAASQAIALRVSVEDGSARSGSDYTPPTHNTYTINKGASVVEFDVPTLADNVPESIEDFRVRISLADATTRRPLVLPRDSVLVKISDHVPIRQTLNLMGPTAPVAEGRPAQFKIKLTDANGQAVRASRSFYVRVRTVSNTAKGATTRAIYLDSSATDSSPQTDGSPQGDPDQENTLRSQLSLNQLVDEQGENCNFGRVGSPNVNNGNCDFRHIGVDGTQSVSSNMQDHCVMIASNQSEKSFFVQTYSDNHPDAGESFQVEISEPRPLYDSDGDLVASCGGRFQGNDFEWPDYAGLGTSLATATLQDTTEASTSSPLLVGFFDNDGYVEKYTVDEPAHPSTSSNAATTRVGLRVRSKKEITTPVTFNWRTKGGTATSGTDYISTGGSITIPSDQPSRDARQSERFEIEIQSDKIVEGDESFRVILTVDAANCQKLKDQKLFVGECSDLKNPESLAPSNEMKKILIADVNIHDADSTTLSFVKNSRGDAFSEGDTIDITEGSDFNCSYSSSSGAWLDARTQGSQNNPNTAHCVFVGVEPSDNVALPAGRIKFYVSATPLAGLSEPKAMLGSDYQGQRSKLMTYTTAMCPNNVCAVPVGCKAGVAAAACRAASGIGDSSFGIKNDNIIERNEAVMLELGLGDNPQSNIRLSSTAKRKKLIIKNDDFANVTIQYARLGAKQGASDTVCGAGQDYKSLHGSDVSIFESVKGTDGNSKLCIKMTCSQTLNTIRSRMTGLLKLNLYKSVAGGNAPELVTIADSNGNGNADGDSDVKLEWSSEDCDGDQARYASLDVPDYDNSESANNQFTLQTQVDDGASASHLHWQQVAVVNGATSTMLLDKVDDHRHPKNDQYFTRQ